MDECKYLHEKERKLNYSVSSVRSKEFQNSQGVLNANAISLRQQGKGKRPNKAQPLAPEEETFLWQNSQRLICVAAGGRRKSLNCAISKWM